MPLTLIETDNCNADLTPSPIEPSWILEGNPEARSPVLLTSADRAATTVIWSCTEGKFNWFDDVDEIIMILEGSIVLESKGMPPKRYGVGDVTFSATAPTPMACRRLRRNSTIKGTCDVAPAGSSSRRKTDNVS